MYKFSCHCNAVRLSVESLPANLTSCNCSICSRYGALWGYFEPEQVTIEADKESVKSYRQGDEYLTFHHCTKCGCMTHYDTTEKMETPRVAINFRMSENKDIRELPLRYFDGADSYEEIEPLEGNWWF